MIIRTVKMLKTYPGSPDGIITREYDKGKVYNLPEELASVFIDLEVAKEVKVKIKENQTEENQTEEKA